MSPNINTSWARCECRGTSPEEGQVCLLKDSVSVASLCIMCSPLVQGLRNESWECFSGLWWIMTLTQLPLTWMSCGWSFPGVRGFTSEPVCVMVGGCLLPLSRGHVIYPKLSFFPLVGDESVQTWLQISLWAMASAPKSAGDDFQDSCWAWPSFEHILLPQPYPFLLRPEMIEKRCHFCLKFF